MLVESLRVPSSRETGLQLLSIAASGSLDLEDNITQGTVVTISTRTSAKEQVKAHAKPAADIAGLSERKQLVIGYIEEHGSAGPTDLQEAFGKSLPTWSRELSALVDEGILKKNGRRYTLA